MKSIGHWTPRYIKNRLAEMHYQRTHPTHPWLTRTAVEILTGYLKPTDTGFEYGSGRSTQWLAKRIGHITSVEHDKAWYDKVSEVLKNNSQNNIAYCHIDVDPKDNEGGDSAYAKRIDQVESASLDFVLVDGSYRDHCAKNAIRTIRPGGVLIIDNVNWYLPSDSVSPKSRSHQQGPNGLVWADVHAQIAGWRKIWTSSGVTDTAFFFKPYSA